MEARLFEIRERRLAALDGLARGHWLGGLTHALGELEPRLQALVSIRSALHEGRLPAETPDWPPAPAANLLWPAMEGLGLGRFCRNRGELADTVLMSLIFHLDFVADYQDRGASELEAARMAVEAFAAEWTDRTGMLDELEDVFGMLPDDGGSSRWDQIRGLLRSESWRNVVAVRRALERLPELARVIQQLGRSRPTPDPCTQVLKEVLEEALTWRTEREFIRVPDLPGQTQGICRSDRIARMLPGEALLLGHPKLRLVWHARRAERALLTYEDDDRMDEERLRPVPVQRPVPGTAPGVRYEMGPMLVCVDTSASMQGGAELVAKAVVLEALRAAHGRGRPCHIFAFGGADEVVELELGMDAEGILAASRFLGQAFRGGTDICAPLERVLARLEESRWQTADLLIASDGEFGATPAMAARVVRARQELGLRVQGVLIGDRETLGFLELADHILPIRDWRRFGGSNTDAPIPDHQLTAKLFPGALRNQANRDATVSGNAAALLVLGGKNIKNEKP